VNRVQQISHRKFHLGSRGIDLKGRILGGIEDAASIATQAKRGAIVVLVPRPVISSLAAGTMRAWARHASPLQRRGVGAGMPARSAEDK